MKKASKNPLMRKVSKDTLIEYCEDVFRKIKRLMNNNQCELCGSGTALQVDHCFSRANKELFYDLRNLTLLCSGCHFRKSKNIKHYDLKVYEHVEGREGSEAFSEMRKCDENRKGFKDWQYIWYHEQQHLKLKEKLSEIMEKTQ